MPDCQEECKEASKEKNERALREHDAKNIEFYSAHYNAWFNTKLEKDKSIITISSAAIGLLITILTSKGVDHYYQIFLYIFAFVGFATSIIHSIDIFDINADHIEKVVTNSGDDNDALHRCEMIIKLSFYAGILFTIFIGSSYSINKLLKDIEEKKMSAEKTKPVQEQIITENFGNSNKLKPIYPPPPKNDKVTKEK